MARSLSKTMLIGQVVVLLLTDTLAVSLPMGQLPHETGRYYTWMNSGQVVVEPDRHGKGE